MYLSLLGVKGLTGLALACEQASKWGIGRKEKWRAEHSMEARKNFLSHPLFKLASPYAWENPPFAWEPVK